jgi:anti-sigma regulatory factor (Ser/Thr protein kinase)
VEIAVRATAESILVSICDFGGEKAIQPSEAPDIDAKLAGLQSPRGWGLFLIKNMVDEMNVRSDGKRHTIELILHL